MYSRLSRSFTARGSVKGGPTKGLLTLQGCASPRRIDCKEGGQCLAQAGNIGRTYYNDMSQNLQLMLSTAPNILLCTFDIMVLGGIVRNHCVRACTFFNCLTFK